MQRILMYATGMYL